MGKPNNYHDAEDIALKDRIAVELGSKSYRVASSSLIYEPNHSCRNLFRISYTTFGMCLQSWEWWFSNLLHIGLSVLYWYYTKIGPDGEKIEPDWPKLATPVSSLLAVTGPLLFFFLVFFNNHAYTRWMSLYIATQAVVGRINDLGVLIRVKLAGHKQAQINILRWIHAAHYTGYYFLPPLRDSSIMNFRWQHLYDIKLLTKREITDLRAAWALDALPLRECVAWALAGLKRAHEQGFLNEQDCYYMDEQVLRMRASFADLYDYSNEPIPFAYYHHLKVLLMMYLIFLSYMLIFFGVWYSIVIMVTASFTLLGLAIVADNIAQPFGYDATDFPVHQYCADLWKDHRHFILHTHERELEGTEVFDEVNEFESDIDQKISKSFHEAAIEITKDKHDRERASKDFVPQTVAPNVRRRLAKEVEDQEKADQKKKKQFSKSAAQSTRKIGKVEEKEVTITIPEGEDLL
jgi:predicted membrane chloride channel (bestrophin family)